MSIDLSWDALPPGIHNGAIHEIDFKFGATVSIVITYRVPHAGVDYFVSEWLTIDAPRTSGTYNATAEGKGRLKQLCEAHRLPLPTKLKPAEIIATLTGKEFRLGVSTRQVNGLPVPKVAAILGKANKPVRPQSTDLPDEEERV
jgi:hypothetical protein